ncbi:uncharacterized protein LOC141531529 [Cotesia typhae]|uniref:uncharacterized protein LOC141531529 n=1 Tax=Cotesia typhae TaxID=2053667 RepID=UPI003D68347C
MYHEDTTASLNDCDSTSMKQPASEYVLEVAMALFGMVWLLRVRSEMRRCSKCRREELLTDQQQQQQQQQQQHHHQQTHPRHHHHHQQQQQHNQHQSLSQTTSLIQTPDDGITMSSVNTLFTLDTPGATGPAGSYCEVHGYVAPKEGTINLITHYKFCSYLINLVQLLWHFLSSFIILIKIITL